MKAKRLFWIGLCALMVAPMLALRAWQAAPARSQGAGTAPAAKPASKPVEVKPAGFNIAPVTNVADPFPTWNGVAVDSTNNVVMFSDLNRHGLFIYDRMAQRRGDESPPPLKHITGNKTGMGFVAGLQFDPAKRVAYIAENDGWGLRTNPIPVLLPVI